MNVEERQDSRVNVYFSMVNYSLAAALF